MQLSGWPQAASSSREFLWKQSLLVSVVMHAALLWIVMQWGHTRTADRALQSQVIEVEVVERVVSSPAEPPQAQSAPLEEISAVRRGADPAIQPQPIEKSEPPLKRQTPDRLQSQAPPQPQPNQKFMASPKRQSSRQQQPQATSQPEPVQTALDLKTEEAGGAAEFQGEQNTEAEQTAVGESSPLGPGRTVDSRADYRKQLKELIERNKQYPLLARRGRQQGQVVVEFDINRNGALSAAKVARSSGHSLLDRAALKAVRAVDRFPEPPANLQENGRYRISISFILE